MIKIPNKVKNSQKYIFAIKVIKILRKKSHDAFKKLFTAGQVGGRQCAMVLQEPWQQIIMFNSLHLIFFPSSLDLA